MHFVQLLNCRPIFENRNYNIGDIVILKSNADEPYVAEICEFYTAKKKKMFRAHYFYRPGDIMRRKGLPEFSPDEVLFSDHLDSHNMNTIISRCDVIPKISNDPFQQHIKEKNRQTLYVCESFYFCRTGL
jgi:hypothetical protein